VKHATSGAIRIHYQDTGEGEPVLVLNGWTGSGLIWPQAWVDDLARDFRLLRVDNRGTGHSEITDDPFTISDMAGDAVAVLDAEGVDSAHVFGLSMGGMIAQTIALEHPERVRTLVLAATAPPAPENVAPEPEVLAQLLAPRDPGLPPGHYMGAIWGAICAPDFPQRRPDVLDALVAAVMAKPTPLEVIMLQLQAIVGFVDPDRLGSIATTTLVLHGTDDPLLPVENGRRLGKLVPDARYEELAGVGHLVPWEAPERTSELMREVLL